jgi:hypothetical protein
MEREYAKNFSFRGLLLYLNSMFSKNMKTEIRARCLETSKYIQNREYEG